MERKDAKELLAEALAGITELTGQDRERLMALAGQPGSRRPNSIIELVHEVASRASEDS